MKNFFKEKGSLFLCIIIVIALAVIILSIVCNWSYFTESTNPIVTLVGIVLAFVSIFLSYKALVVTNEVKQEVGLQQFRIEQHKVVAKLVYKLNMNFFKIHFQTKKTDNKSLNAETHVNLYGLVELLKDTEHDFNSFRTCSVFYEGDNPLMSIYEFIGNPYLPLKISTALSRFPQSVNQKPIDHVNYLIFKRTSEKEDCQTSSQINRIRLYSSWDDLIDNIYFLLKEIVDWYKEEYNDTNINLVPIKKIESYKPRQK